MQYVEIVTENQNKTKQKCVRIRASERVWIPQTTKTEPTKW